MMRFGFSGSIISSRQSYIFILSIFVYLFGVHAPALAQQNINLLCEVRFVDEKPLNQGPGWFVSVFPGKRTMTLDWKNKKFVGRLQLIDNSYVSYIDTDNYSMKTFVSISRVNGNFSLFTELTKGNLVDYSGVCKPTDKKLLF